MGLDDIAFQFSYCQRICFQVLRRAVMDLVGSDPEWAASARYLFNHFLHEPWCRCVGLDPRGVLKLLHHAGFLEDRSMNADVNIASPNPPSPRYPVVKRPRLEDAGFCVGRDMEGKVLVNIVGQFALLFPPELARMLASALNDEADYAEKDIQALEDK